MKISSSTEETSPSPRILDNDYASVQFCQEKSSAEIENKLIEKVN